MATQSAVIWDETFTAENDLSTKQFFAVELSGADQVDVCDNASDRVLGILQNKPKAGEEAVVRILGKSKAVSDGSGTAIAPADLVGTDANGRIVKKTADADRLAGISNGTSSASGTVIEIFLTFGAQRAS